jgi:3-oxoacyl-[acyl-carrier-protein] synthase II
MESLMSCAPAITGIGLVTALGQSADETWKALLAGRSVSDHARVAGFPGERRTVAMALHAAAEALGGAGWNASDCGGEETALIVGTSKGIIEPLLKSKGSGVFEKTLDPFDFGELAERFHFGWGPRLTISSACSSGLHALARATMAIQGGEAARVLVVATEASVHPLFISSFKRLGVLSPEGHGCRPFDQSRQGFIITEAAVAVCLENPENPVGRPIAKIDAWALGSDATHLTGCDPQATALRNLLKHIAPGNLDLIHAHATGTVINDPVELSAIATIAGESHPILYSHKAALGHSLGAAGLVSVVLNCLCHRTGIVPGNIRSPSPLPMHGLIFPHEPMTRPIHRSLALAAGFAGPLAAVLLSS